MAVLPLRMPCEKERSKKSRKNLIFGFYAPKFSLKFFIEILHFFLAGTLIQSWMKLSVHKLWQTHAPAMPPRNKMPLNTPRKLWVPWQSFLCVPKNYSSHVSFPWYLLQPPPSQYISYLPPKPPSKGCIYGGIYLAVFTQNQKISKKNVNQIPSNVLREVLKWVIGIELWCWNLKNSKLVIFLGIFFWTCTKICPISAGVVGTRGEMNGGREGWETEGKWSEIQWDLHYFGSVHA